MRRWLGWLAIGWMLLICLLALVAYGSPARAQSLDQRVQSLASQLRCPICQGETVADSQADIAVAIRRLIRKNLAAGQSPDAIRAYLLSRYPNISLTPSSSGIGQIAWLGPPLLVAGGVALLVALVVDWRRRGRAPSDPVLPEYLDRVRAELAGEAIE